MTKSEKLAQSESDNAILLTTGASEATKLQNIYDIAGNAWEWTLEYSGSNEWPCACRGGCYNYNGGYNPANSRGSGNIYSSIDYIGFRVSLY